MKKILSFAKLTIIVYFASFLFSFGVVLTWYALGGCEAFDPIKALINANRTCTRFYTNSEGIWIKDSLANDRFELKEDVLPRANMLFGVLMFFVLLTKVPNKKIF
ncbi:MAG: hypothetical protein HYW33_03360 [Candidatus Blackburnbacteria bacterium]|nr:hypothetical protein [Candidatus Blackburnbacteria bacterium]